MWLHVVPGCKGAVGSLTKTFESNVFFEPSGFVHIAPLGMVQDRIPMGNRYPDLQHFTVVTGGQ